MELSYKSLRFMRKETFFTSFQPDFVVKSHGYGHEFQAEIPFSWLLFEVINEVRRMSVSSKQSGKLK